MPGTDNKYDMLSDNARQEEIRLKKIRQGLIADTENEEYLKKKEQEKYVPMSFKEKISNFWYHYKWTTLVVSMIVVAVAVFAVQLLTRTNYDTTVILGTYGNLIERESETGKDASYYVSYSQEALDSISNEFNKYVADINDNGAVDVAIFQARYLQEGIEGDSTGYQSALQAAIMARIADGSDCIYILEKDILDTLSGRGVFTDLNKPFGMRSEDAVFGLPVSQLGILKNEEFSSARDNLYIAVRVYKDGIDKALYDAQLNAVKEMYFESIAR